MEWRGAAVKQPSELEIATIPGDETMSRVVICLKTTDQKSVFALQQQSFSQNVGWFVQSEIELSRQQLAGVYSALGFVGGKNREAAWQAADASEPSSADVEIAILQFPAVA